MPRVPEPVGSPDELVFLRWVRDTLMGVTENAALKERSDYNTNSTLSGTMSLVISRLGEVQASVDAIIGAATFSASQVTSGVFNTARIPTLDFSKVSGGSASVASISTSGNANIGGHVYVPNSTIASFGSWTVAYIDGDGRLTRGASSAKYKVDIVPAPEDGDYFSVRLSEFAMKGGNGQRVLGYIAEHLSGTDMERFLQFERECDENGNYKIKREKEGTPVVLSIDFISLLMAQNVQLKRELDASTGRLEDVELRLDALEGNK